MIKVDWGTVGAYAFYVVIVIVVVFWFIWSDGNNKKIEESRKGSTCKDVTSIDDNWNNDMLCTRPDGKIFYTDYDGAKQYR